MRHTTRLAVLVSALAVIIGAVFLTRYPQPSAGQNLPAPNRKPACSCFCGDASFNSFNIFDIADINAGKCYGGPLGAKECRETLTGLPPGELKTFCQKVKERGASSCPAIAGLCEQPPEDKPKCIPPAEGSEDGPWNGADCKDFQDVLFRLTRGSFVISACGQILYKYAGMEQSMVPGLKDAWPKKICCDKLKGPRNTPCNYSADLDCDGTPNMRDSYPDNYGGEESFYTIPKGTTYDPLPPGLRLSQLLPDIACDGCKWVLVKGNMKCTAKSSGTGLFWYEATWKCPKTGMEVWRPSKQRLLRQKCNRS